MGVFDLFGRDPKTKNNRFDFQDSQSFASANSQTDRKSPVSVFVPSSYEEVEKIIDSLKNGKTAVVHLTELKTETAIRILDMLSGAIYALGGGVYEMEKNIFMFAPTGVEVHEK